MVDIVEREDVLVALDAAKDKGLDISYWDMEYILQRSTRILDTRELEREVDRLNDRIEYLEEH